jgi:hypothetical protein
VIQIESIFSTDESSELTISKDESDNRGKKEQNVDTSSVYHCDSRREDECVIDRIGHEICLQFLSLSFSRLFRSCLNTIKEEREREKERKKE